MLPKFVDIPYEVYCPIYDETRTVYVHALRGYDGEIAISGFNGCNDLSNDPACVKCAKKVQGNCDTAS